jgi:hypothetical protein
MELFSQPRFGGPPFLFDGGQRTVELLGDLVIHQAAENAQDLAYVSFRESVSLESGAR